MSGVELKAGLRYESKKLVADSDTASQFGSGGIAVFATPMMIGLMENAAMNCVSPALAEGESTVGIKLDVSHMAATPVGMEVRAVAELIEVDGRKLRFRVEAFDSAEKIGEGIHERFIISIDKFMKKVQAKALM